MRRSSAAIPLVLLGSAVALGGFSAWQHQRANRFDSWDDSQYGSSTQPTTRPVSHGYSGSHYYHSGHWWWWGGGSSNTGSSGYHSTSSSTSGHSSSASHTSRGGFGSSGHSASS